jgi:hypothetical protein
LYSLVVPQRKAIAHDIMIGYALLSPIFDLGDRWFGLGVVVYIVDVVL